MGRFTEDTAVQRIGPSRWQSTIKKGWRVGAVPNGGYLLAIMGRALGEALDHKDPLTVSAFYMSPCALGDCDIEVESLKTGKGTSFGSASLMQDGELKIRATAAFSKFSRLSGPTWLGGAPPAVLAFEDAAHLRANVLEFHEHVDARLVVGHEVFAGDAPPETGEFVSWLSYTDGSRIRSIDLLMMADIMPPPPFTLFGPFGWVPTIELTVQIRGEPAPGPILGRLRSQHLTDGIVESDGDFWDAAGQLVALSRQTMKVRLPKPDS